MQANTTLLILVILNLIQDHEKGKINSMIPDQVRNDKRISNSLLILSQSDLTKQEVGSIHLSYFLLPFLILLRL